MKITKSQLKQIIKEELEEVVSVYGHPRMQEFPRPDFGGIEKKAMKALKKKQKPHRKTQVELPGDMYKQMMKVAGKDTQAEEPPPMTDKVSDFIELIAASNLSREEKDRLMQALRENNMKLVKEILLEIYKVEQ